MSAFAFKKVKNVTLPLFKLANNEPNYLRFDEPVFVGKVVVDKKEPPTMANVTDLETGEQGQIILGSVLLENLNQHYPDNAYVGKSFEIVKHSPEGARKYSLWNVAEIEVEVTAPAAAPEKTEVPAKKGK